VVIQLQGYEPPPRTDGLTWTDAVIESSTASSGPWTEVNTVVLNPTDADPANPIVRNFGINDTNGTPETWYRVYFKDQAGRQSLPSTPITAAFRVTYLPALHEVGSMNRSRTRTPGGQELGTFTSATRPTSSDVRDLIRQAGNTVANSVGRDVPPRFQEAARALVTLRTNMLIELSYFPEQVQSNRSPYQQWKELYDADLASLVLAIGESGQGDDDAGDAGFPSYGGFDGDNYTSMSGWW
jgi:hypothetical protein